MLHLLKSLPDYVTLIHAGLYICNFIIIFLDSLAMLLRLECSSMTLAHCSLDLSGSSNPLTSASGVAGTTDVCYHTHLIFVSFFVETGLLHVAQAGLELLG